MDIDVSVCEIIGNRPTGWHLAAAQCTASKRAKMPTIARGNIGICLLVARPPLVSSRGSAQRKAERRALVQRGVSPDPAAVTVDDPLDNRQPDPGALVLLGAVQPLKHAKQLVAVAHIKAHAVIVDRVDRLRPIRLTVVETTIGVLACAVFLAPGFDLRALHGHDCETVQQQLTGHQRASPARRRSCAAIVSSSVCIATGLAR